MINEKVKFKVKEGETLEGTVLDKIFTVSAFSGGSASKTMYVIKEFPHGNVHITEPCNINKVIDRFSI